MCENLKMLHLLVGVNEMGLEPKAGEAGQRPWSEQINEIGAPKREGGGRTGEEEGGEAELAGPGNPDEVSGIRGGSQHPVPPWVSLLPSQDGEVSGPAFHLSGRREDPHGEQLPAAAATDGPSGQGLLPGLSCPAARPATRTPSSQGLPCQQTPNHLTAPCLGVLWTPPLQLACSLATLQASRWDPPRQETLLQLPWEQEGQEPSRFQSRSCLCPPRSKGPGNLPWSSPHCQGQLLPPSSHCDGRDRALGAGG